MRKTYLFIHSSLFVLLTCLGTPHDANAAVRVGNVTRSYADAYNQVNAMRQQAEYYNQQDLATTTVSSDELAASLPVRVADKNLAEQVIAGVSGNDGSISMDQLERCAMVYPNGEFAWDRPNLGSRAGGSNTCVAVVEMRGYQMGVNGSDVVLARANLATGDSVKCNISEFPEATYMKDAENIEFPADNEPTIDDVVKVMNEEQKKNAGLKIAAGAIIGGLGGNIAGKSDVGNDSLLGTDKGKLQGTAIGALSGAALMAGSTYAGKVGGDIILSTGVNAAAGALVGNIIAIGDSVLRIEDCEVDGRKTSCLWGYLVFGEELNDKKAFYNTSTRETFVCDSYAKNCQKQELINVVLTATKDGKRIDELNTAEFEDIVGNQENLYYIATSADGKNLMVKNSNDLGSDNAEIDEDQGEFLEIAKAEIIKSKIAAIIPDVTDKAFGMDKSDWREWKKLHSNGVKIYARDNQGNPSGVLDGDVANFDPITVDAEDGGIIDLSNKARFKTTLTGAGVGGAMGAFSAYQGAQTDIQNRWVTAVREYNDSLQKIYCVTGDRFLGYYNDIVFIPVMSE